MGKKTDISETIRGIMRTAGWTQEQLAKRLSVSQSTVARWLAGSSYPNGRAFDELKTMEAAHLAGRFSRDTEKIRQILARSYDPDETESRPVSDLPGGAAYSDIIGWVGSIPGALPEIDLKAGAGEGVVGQTVALGHNGETYSGHEVVDEWRISDNFLRFEAKASKGKSIVAEVIGDSMFPTYLPGDRVIIDLSQNRLVADTVYLISDGFSEPQIKRLQRIPFSDPPRVKIISDNEALENFEVDLSRLKIYGRVCAAVSRR